MSYIHDRIGDIANSEIQLNPESIFPLQMFLIVSDDIIERNDRNPVMISEDWIDEILVKAGVKLTNREKE
jgi:hypothetical protein